MKLGFPRLSDMVPHFSCLWTGGHNKAVHMKTDLPMFSQVTSSLDCLESLWKAWLLAAAPERGDFRGCTMPLGIC